MEYNPDEKKKKYIYIYIIITLSLSTKLRSKVNILLHNILLIKLSNTLGKPSFSKYRTLRVGLTNPF